MVKKIKRSNLQKSAKFLKEQLEWNRNEREFKKEDKIIEAALQSLYQMSPDEARQYLSLISDRAEIEWTRTLRKVVSDVHLYPAPLDAGERFINDYEQKENGILSHYLIQRVLSKSINEEDLQSALTAAGARTVNHPGIGNILEGMEELEKVVRFSQSFLDPEIVSLRTSGIRTALQQVREIYQLGGKMATRLYLDDLCTLLQEQISLARIIGNVSGNAYVLPFALRMDTEGFLDVLGLMKNHHQDYLQLTSTSAAALLQAVPVNSEGCLGRVQRVAKVVRYFPEEKLLSLVKLVQNTEDTENIEEEAKADVFQLVANNLFLVDVCETLEHAGLRSSEITSFLLEGSILKTEQGTTIQNYVVEHYLENPKAMAIVARHAETVARQVDMERLTSLLSYSWADMVLEDYFSELQNHQPARAEALLSIGLAQPGQNEYQQLRKRIRAMTEEQCQRLPPSSFPEWRMAIFAIKDKEQKSSPEKTGEKKLSARELLLQELKEDAPALMSKVQPFYDSGNTTTQYRLRKMWRSQPETISSFCDDLKHFKDNPAFTLLLRTRELYAAYQKRLGEKDTTYRQQLEQMAESSNLYSSLCELLLNKKDKPRTAFPQATVSIDENHVPQGNYRRIVVFGGQYAREAKDKIKQASDKLPIEVFDLFTHRESVANIHPDDLVIYVTTSTNHSLYAAVKRHCRAQGIELYHHSRSGHHPLMEIIRQVSAAR